MVMETSSIVAAGYTGNYPATVQGDANAILDVIEAVSNAGGIGVCCFDSSYIRTLTRNYEEDRAIQEKYGIDSSTYGKEYDSQSEVTGEMFEGKSFFGEDGTALESLKLFALCHKGNLIEVKADALEDDEIDIETGDDIRLPETVTAIMNDNSRSEVPVKWQALDLNELQKTGPRKITVNGEADGLPVRFSINIIEHNYLRDPSFEEDSNNTVIPSGWQVVEHMNAQELGVKENVIDSLSGKKHYHFCSKQRDMIDFDLYQELTDLPSGTYRFQISATGGGFNENRSYAYVLIDGESYMSYGLSFTSDSWSTAIFQAVPYESGQKLTVGIRIIGNDDGNGAYGRIDDAMLNLLEE